MVIYDPTSLETEFSWREGDESPFVMFMLCLKSCESHVDPGRDRVALEYKELPLHRAKSKKGPRSSRTNDDGIFECYGHIES